MKIISGGVPLQVVGQRGPMGPSGPDGNPLGTIISFMGTTAPKDYLVCDGKEYSVYEYGDLADFFEVQFGSKYYFGGNDDELFAVPDMRNLFLRGYHGESSEQLSTDVGKKQDGTEFPSMGKGTGNNWNGTGPNGVSIWPINKDSEVGEPGIGYSGSLGVQWSSSTYPPRYTSRPVNMAVLYCIKATKEEPGEIYSEEEVCIGRWVDGKPLYRICVRIVLPVATSSYIDYDIKNLDTITDIRSVILNPYQQFMPAGFYSSANSYFAIAYNLDSHTIQFRQKDYGGSVGIVTIEYTKTTDDPIS